MKTALTGLFLTVALAACGGSSTPQPTTTAPTASNTADPSCPVAVAGTSVTVEDDATGASLVFVTTGDVGELRRRVGELAKMHNEHHGAMGALPDGQAAGGGHAGHDMHAGGHGGHDMHAGGHGGHDMHAGGHPAGGHPAGGHHAGHAGGMIGVHSKASAVEVEGGAKLQIVVDPADVATLQSELRKHAQHLASGTCAMDKSS